MENFNLISDTEVRQLLKSRLLTHVESDDTFTQEIFNMEMNTAFNAGVFLAPNTTNEHQLLENLKNNLKFKSGIKWLGISIGTIAITASAFIAHHYSKNRESSFHVNEKAAPQTTIAMQTKVSPPSAIPNIESITIDSNQSKLLPPSPPKDLPPPSSLFLYQDLELPILKNPVPPTLQLFENDLKTTGLIASRNKDKNSIDIDTLFKGIQQLEVTGMVFNVNIKTIKTDQVHLAGAMKCETKGLYVQKAEYKMHYERNGASLRVWMENHGKANTLIFGSMLFEGFLNIEVPENIDIVIKSASGDITANGLSGKVCQLESNYGNILAEQIKTDVKASSTSGSIQMKNINGNINAKASYGNLNLEKVTGSVNANCISGNIAAAFIESDIILDTKYGNIQAQDINGDAKISNTSGTISLNRITAEIITLNASYGQIRASNLNGKTTINSLSGDVVVDQLNGDLSVSTTYGNQLLKGIKGDVKSNSISGNINAQQCKGAIQMRASYGNINLSDCNGSMNIFVQSGDISGRNVEVVTQLEMRSQYGSIHMQLKNKVEDLSFDLGTSSGTITIEKETLKQSKENGQLTLNKGPIKIIGFSQSGDLLIQ